MRHVASFLEEAQGVVAAEHFSLDNLPAASLTSYRTPKRVLDVALVVLMAPLALPLLLAATLAVILVMGPPAIFAQERVGLGGRTFTMYKLRTMRPEPNGAATATVHGDRRITPLGRWLRRFRIDELPQLWNVLNGDMSLVGPRPEQPSLAADYIRHVPAFAYRHLVRPGITGWAQVRAGYAADLAETRIKLGYDLFYVKNVSFGLDMRILGRTLVTLATGGGVR
ncbi:MAG: sugar transferase [Caulobacteraceae bacterium]|nr:sugar transferase [Caulobacteraceae bacterium]